jgi:peptidoglycan/xylan/chitin deacetylase (PgdA/CDA1 family)
MAGLRRAHSPSPRALCPVPTDCYSPAMRGTTEQGRRTPRAVAKAVVLGLLRYSGAAFAARHLFQRRRLTVLAYHDPEAEVFRRHLGVLRRLYSVVSLDEVLRALRDGDVRALPRRALLITFDDGWAGNRGLRDSLASTGVRPTVFLCTSLVGTSKHYWWTHVPDAVERDRLKLLDEQDRLRELATIGFAPETEYAERQALSLDEVDALADVVDFQAHTRSHPVLPTCSDERAETEIAGSADDIERLTGRRPAAFAYPNGNRSARDVELVKHLGFECAFTTDPGYIDAGADAYQLKRIMMDDAAGATDVVVRASGIYGRLKPTAPRVPR